MSQSIRTYQLGGRSLASEPRPVGKSLTPDEVEFLASRSHENYRSQSSGGQPTVPYAELEDDEQEANRALVRDWPQKLADVGYRITDDPDDPRVVEQLPESSINELAVSEHSRWLRFRAEHGYVWGPTRDDAPSRRTHPDMLPWSRSGDQVTGTLDGFTGLGPGELDEAEREKDRAKVREIVPLLRELDLYVVPS